MVKEIHGKSNLSCCSESAKTIHAFSLEGVNFYVKFLKNDILRDMASKFIGGAHQDVKTKEAKVGLMGQRSVEGSGGTMRAFLMGSGAKSRALLRFTAFHRL